MSNVDAFLMYVPVVARVGVDLLDGGGVAADAAHRQIRRDGGQAQVVGVAGRVGGKGGIGSQGSAGPVGRRVGGRHVQAAAHVAAVGGRVAVGRRVAGSGTGGGRHLLTELVL
jgi:hypothetical protein